MLAEEVVVPFALPTSSAAVVMHGSTEPIKEELPAGDWVTSSSPSTAAGRFNGWPPAPQPRLRCFTTAAIPACCHSPSFTVSIIEGSSSNACSSSQSRYTS